MPLHRELPARAAQGARRLHARGVRQNRGGGRAHKLRVTSRPTTLVGGLVQGEEAEQRLGVVVAARPGAAGLAALPSTHRQRSRPRRGEGLAGAHGSGLKITSADTSTEARTRSGHRSPGRGGARHDTCSGFPACLGAPGPCQPRCLGDDLPGGGAFE